MLEVVARVIFLHGGETVYDLATGQHRLHSQHGAVQAAVPEVATGEIILYLIKETVYETDNTFLKA